jgi:hypothetical protein
LTKAVDVKVGEPGPVAVLARMMGTSFEMLDKTYRHLLRDAASCGRTALDAFDAAQEAESESFGRGVDVGE